MTKKHKIKNKNKQSISYPGPSAYYLSKKENRGVEQKISKSTKNNLGKASKYARTKLVKTKKRLQQATQKVEKKVKKPFAVVKNVMNTRENQLRIYFNGNSRSNLHFKDDPTANKNYLNTQSEYLQAQVPKIRDAIDQGYYGRKLTKLGILIKKHFATKNWHYSFMEFTPAKLEDIKKTLVLWHGIGSWCGDLCAIKNLANKGVYIIAVDLLGHGASNADAQPGKIDTPKGHIDDYKQWTDQIGKTTKAIQKIVDEYLNVGTIIAGISLSGMLTTRAIIDYAEDLPRKVILISPGYAAAGGLWLGETPILKHWKGLVNVTKRYVPSLNRNSPFYIGDVLRMIKNIHFSKGLNYNTLYTGHMTKEHEEYVANYYKKRDVNQEYVTTEVTDKLFGQVAKVSLGLEKLIAQGKINKRQICVITTGKSKLDDKIICKYLINRHIQKLKLFNNEVTQINLDEVEDHEPIFNYERVNNRPKKQDVIHVLSEYIL